MNIPSAGPSPPALRNSAASVLRVAFLLAVGLPLGLPTVAAAQPLSANCPHVVLLNRSDANQVHKSERQYLEDPTRQQSRVIGDALDLLPPLLCHAVRRIAVLKDTTSTFNAKVKPNDRQNLIYINEAGPFWSALGTSTYRALAIQSILHESAHVGTWLLHAISAAGPPSLLRASASAALWPPAVQARARAIIDRLRLEKGLLQEWDRVHGSFVAQGFAGKYAGGSWKQNAGADHVANGFTSAYSSEMPIEDIAEFTGWALVEPELPSGMGPGPGGRNQACREMSAEPGPSVPGRFAAVYTKMRFLADLGFVDQAAYDRCVGKLKIEAPAEGVFTYRSDGSPSRRYTTNPRGRIGNDPNTGRYAFVFEVDGRPTVGGQPADAQLQLKLQVSPIATLRGIKDASWPRGLYVIAHPRRSPRSTSGNEFWMRLPKKGDKTWYAEDALVMVASSSEDLIEGSLFIRKGWRPLAPSPTGGVPQVGFPMRAAFRLEN